jgi:peptide/nickel transport system permease protein
VSVATFWLLRAATDPASAIAGPDATAQEVAQVRAEYGFDRPIAIQYWAWLRGVLSGDFGHSYFWRTAVGPLILSHAPVTIELALSAILVTILVALPLGIAAALRPNTVVDRVALTVAVAAQAIPNFWLGVMCIVLFAVKFPVFPVSGDKTWVNFVLPAIVLGTSSVPAVMRLTRTGLLEVMSSDYIRTARAKGFVSLPLLLRHALRNALLPVVSVLAVQLGHKLGGSFIVETVFAMNGLGRLAMQSVLGADIPTIQMLVFIFSLTFVVMTFLADLLNAWIDPRIRLS